MRKITKIGCAALACMALVGCTPKENPADTAQPTAPAVENVNGEEALAPVTTMAIVSEINDEFITVETMGNEEGTAYEGALLIPVESLDEESKAGLAELEIGDYTSLTYNGSMTMSLPAQVRGEVKLIEVEAPDFPMGTETPEAEVETDAQNAGEEVEIPEGVEVPEPERAEGPESTTEAEVEATTEAEPAK